MKRVPYTAVFRHAGGTLTPLMPLQIRLAGMEMTMPPGMSVAVGQPGVSISFGGVDFNQFVGRELEIQTLPDGLTLITHIYAENE